ncbi:uncharacterized protein LOC119767020 [Culex quinquefasciatus]|uniref:uncharacterized protein LOC119767020 n=1 Tax=Culex quinquefasciatus TaxID=7176 RepID=UPI0018E36D64|nr:uncharacterized protein LOC119767020 [Culex quinquefasciatus]
MKDSFPGNRFVISPASETTTGDDLAASSSATSSKRRIAGISDFQNGHGGPDQATGNNGAQSGSRFSKWFRRGGDKSRPGRTKRSYRTTMPSASPSSRTTVQKNVQAPVRHGGPWSPEIPSQQELQFHTQSITQNALLRKKLKYRPLRSGQIRPSSSSSRTPKQTNSWGR